MRRLLMALLAVSVTGCPAVQTPVAKAKVTLEIRPGESSPQEGYTAATVAGGELTVYLAREAALKNEDVKSARVVAGAHGPEIQMVFTKEGARKLSRMTEANLMKPIGILVDGQLICAPIVRARITGGQAVISGRFTAAEAKRIADGIAGR